MDVVNTENELIAAAKTGDAKATTALYKSYYRLILGYLYNQTSSITIAEDITQETFLRAFKSISTFAGKASFKNWLFQITKNLIADHWKQQIKTSNLDIEDIYNISDSSFMTYCNTLLDETTLNEVQEQNNNKLEQILQKLSNDYRLVLEYRFLHGYSLKEVADKLNISLSNAKVRQYRALQQAKSIANTMQLYE